MMDSNQLLHYLRGFFELVPEPTADQIRAIRNEVLSSTPVEQKLIPVEVVRGTPPAGMGDCGCSGKSTSYSAPPPPPPRIDPSKL